ncbi:MAG: XF1762 family protein [Anaerolinea sp.]
MMLELQPISFEEACEFVRLHHRHHIPPQSWKFGIAVNDGEKVVGVIMVDRPVARFLDDGWTLEVRRCVTDGTKNVASMLYAAAWRAAKAMGYKRMITYTLASEKGGSLVAAGWRCVYQTKGGTWNCRSRPRVDKHPTIPKLLWEAR